MNLLSIRHEYSARQVASLTADAIETGYSRKNPFQVDRSSRMMFPFPPQTGRKDKIKPLLPSSFSDSKWIFLNLTSCCKDHRQRDNLASRVLVADRQ
ncbi:hypothetical protein AVEN_152676-1 [Araneus ventricosus]|uniref:Uncharacterized protein n=1 Tax=Araneus ventricosus TaxID=182803 RepID=A0A4Y2HW03_ARAVE|nr:hypothetical protein AVEN_152676-1 [Araneus ventricosus]